MNVDRYWTFDHEDEVEPAGQTPSPRLTVRYTGTAPDGTGMPSDLGELSPYAPVDTALHRLNVDRKRTFDHGPRTGHMGHSVRRYNASSWPVGWLS